LIKGEWVMAAIDSHLKLAGLSEVDSTKAAGLDVAVEGKNRSVYIRRSGCVVEAIEALPAQDTTQTSFQVDKRLRDDSIDRFCFDSDGVGAGVAGTIAAIENKPYSVIAFRGGGSPSKFCVWEGENLNSNAKFANQRAEQWYKLAERFRKTYEVINGINDHPLYELISIPANQQLLLELSQPTVLYNATGKLLIESKIAMKKRGISSPDYADALVLSFVEGVSSDWFDG